MVNAPLAWAVLPILRGRLRGKRWLLASRINFFLGTYEQEETQIFEQLVRPGDVVYDIGAHYGYYTLLASELVGASGKVFAFEPCPRNLSFLRRHIALNGCSNVEVFELAIADHEGKARFEDRTGSGLAHLAPDGSIEVKVTTLQALARQLPPPTVMKIDVEGAEYDLLRGGGRVIENSLPLIFLSLHGDDLRMRCLSELRDYQYEFLDMSSDDVVACPRGMERRRSREQPNL